jgi:hypothetical protein
MLAASHRHGLAREAYAAPLVRHGFTSEPYHQLFVGDARALEIEAGGDSQFSGRLRLIGR